MLHYYFLTCRRNSLRLPGLFRCYRQRTPVLWAFVREEPAAQQGLAAADLTRDLEKALAVLHRHEQRVRDTGDRRRADVAKGPRTLSAEG